MCGGYTDKPEECLISVVIPTYNRAEYLERSIKSVLNQNYKNLEVLIVDDGSTDRTEEVVTSLSDERLRYIRQACNQGAPVARNKGVACAKGEWVAFQDSDDCWHSDKLSRQMSYWQQHSEYSMIYSAYQLRRINGDTVRVPYAETWGNLEGDIFQTLLVNNTVGTPTMLFRRQCFQEIGGFREGMECLEDWDFSLRFAEKYKIGFVEEPLVDAFLVSGGISSNVGKFCLNRCRMIVWYKKQLLDRGLFDRVVGDLVKRAKDWGILEQVEAMLTLMLTTPGDIM
ncbi:MAG: glycosyltransferase [Clostridiales bacterium]|nr:glycosyltransferase [Clostridiales bacterium]